MRLVLLFQLLEPKVSLVVAHVIIASIEKKKNVMFCGCSLYIFWRGNRHVLSCSLLSEIAR